MNKRSNSLKIVIISICLSISFLASVFSMFPRSRGDYLGYMELFRLENFEFISLRSFEIFQILISLFASLTFPELGFFIFNMINLILVILILDNFKKLNDLEYFMFFILFVINIQLIGNMWYMRQLTGALLISYFGLKNAAIFKSIFIALFHLNSFFVNLLINSIAIFFNLKSLKIFYAFSLLFLILFISGIYTFDANKYVLRLFFADLDYGWYLAAFNAGNPVFRITYEIILSIIIISDRKFGITQFDKFILIYLIILFILEAFFFSLGELTNRISFYFDIFLLCGVLQRFSHDKSFFYIIIAIIISLHGLYRGLSSFYII